jgi:hypothetical protein
VFAVGYYGSILHYDGTRWSAQRTSPTIYLFAIWGASETNVFAVGDSILHYDGTGWSAQRVAPTFGVWGSWANDVYAVGDYGSILHYDGISWTLQACSCPRELDGIWGMSSSDVFAVGMGGGIAHYDGTRWAVQESGTSTYLWGVWGSSRTTTDQAVPQTAYPQAPIGHEAQVTLAPLRGQPSPRLGATQRQPRRVRTTTTERDPK